MGRFYDFLYVDDDLVSRLLSGIEGGSFDSVEEQWSQSSNTREAGSVDEEASSESSRSASSSSTRSLKQNTETKFSRLWKAVENDSDENIITHENFSSDFDSMISSFCRIDGRLSVPPVVGLLASSAEILNLGRLGQQFGLFAPSASDMEKLEAAAAMRELIKDTFPVIVNSSSGLPVIALSLRTVSSRATVDRYAGRATVFGRIVDYVPTSETFPLINLPGLGQANQLSRQQRRQQSKARGKGASTSDDQTELRGPLLIVKALAVSQ